MMRRLLPCLLTALAAVIVPHMVAAQEAKKRPERPHNPEVLFKRLDRNSDGVVTPDEVPEGAPERLKEMLKRADKNKDKKLTAAEFMEAVKRRRGGPPHHGGPPHAKRPGPQRRPGSPAARPGPPHAQRRPGLPDPKALFMRMDKNKDKKLSFEEFAEGMKRVHQMLRPSMRRPVQPQIRRPSPPQIRRPSPSDIIERLKAADKNKDGKLSKEEAPGPFKAHFEKIDANKDGQLTLDEIKAAVAKRRAEMKKRAEARKKAADKPESKN